MSAAHRGSAVHGADFHRRMEARMTQLEGEVQRVHDEVEACSVLILSLDASAASPPGGAPRTGGGTDSAVAEVLQADAARMGARIEVLEHAWANRSAAQARDVEDAMARLEREIMELWRQVRAQEDAHLPPLRELTREMQTGLQEVRGNVDSLREELAQSNAGSLEQRSLDDLVNHLTTELGRTAGDFERRCDRLEEGLARIEAGEVAVRADRQRAAELERMMELLVQQRREDILATNAQLREIDAQLRQIKDDGEREVNWRNEATDIRAEVEELKISKIPAIASQSSRASQLIAEGLQALRKEVQDLRDRKAPSRKEVEDASALEAGLEMARVKAEVDDLRQQVTKALVGGFEDRLLGLRADFAAEVEGAVREVRESWADTSRRLAALEPWQRESAQLHAELRQLKIERQEDQSRFNVKMHDELLAQRAAITEGVETRLAGFRHDIGVNPTKALRALSPDPGSGSPQRGITDAIRDAVVGSSRPAGSGGAPVVLGRRIEWALSASALLSSQRARAGKKPEPIVTGELEVAGIRCRLKFYPNGSPLKTLDGYCSLYLLALVPVAVRFHLFAGPHVSPILECNYDRRRDQGRHDLCVLDEALDDDGGIVIGAELLDVQPLLATAGGGHD